MTEPTEADDYGNHFDTNGQPVRRGVALTAEELATYRQYFPDATDQTTTEETH